jgi:single-strand DNA-binding protein
MNILTVTGNLGKDAEVRTAGSGTVCGFSVAITAGYGDKKQTVWLDCSVWGKQAEGALPGYLKKGQQVAVSGELSTREHEGKTYLQLRCNTIDLIGKKDDSQSSAAPRPAPVAQAPAAPAAAPADDFSDDVPF